MMRYFKEPIENDVLHDFKIAAITGPRQVGNTDLMKFGSSPAPLLSGSEETANRICDFVANVGSDFDKIF